MMWGMDLPADDHQQQTRHPRRIAVSGERALPALRRCPTGQLVCPTGSEACPVGCLRCRGASVESPASYCPPTEPGPRIRPHTPGHETDTAGHETVGGVFDTTSAHVRPNDRLGVEPASRIGARTFDTGRPALAPEPATPPAGSSPTNAGGDDRRELVGLLLRYFLTVTLIDAGREVTVKELGERLADRGCGVAGRTSKVISDALRWEVRRGRVTRTGRGRYRSCRFPRQTEAWMRARLGDELNLPPREVRTWPVGGWRVGWNACERGRELAAARAARIEQQHRARDLRWQERTLRRRRAAPRPHHLDHRDEAEAPGEEGVAPTTGPPGTVARRPASDGPPATNSAGRGADATRDDGIGRHPDHDSHPDPNRSGPRRSWRRRVVRWSSRRERRRR